MATVMTGVWEKRFICRLQQPSLKILQEREAESGGTGWFIAMCGLKGTGENICYLQHQQKAPAIVLTAALRCTSCPLWMKGMPTSVNSLNLKGTQGWAYWAMPADFQTCCNTSLGCMVQGPVPISAFQLFMMLANMWEQLHQGIEGVIQAWCLVLEGSHGDIFRLTVLQNWCPSI